MERTVKIKYSDIYFAVLNTVIDCKQHFKKDEPSCYIVQTLMNTL